MLLDPQAFAYDAVGNRTTGGSVVNTGNQLTADANFAYQYDDNGNLTRKTLLATGNSARYTYDAYGNILDRLWRSQSGIDDAMERVSNSPFPDPHNGLQDAYFRGFASCVLSREHSEFETHVLGWANEQRGDCFHSQEEVSHEADERNNACEALV